MTGQVDQKQLAEFTDSIQRALAMFTSQSDQVKALQGQVQTLEQRVVELAQDPKAIATGRDKGFGFHDGKTAGEFVKMMKAVFGNDALAAKDMTEGSDSEGGYTVLPVYRNTLISLMEIYGLARQRCTILPMSSNELTMPKLTGGVQVYWVGEGKTIGQTQPTFGELKLTVKKLAALVPMTSELLDDTSISIANLLAMLFAQALAKEEDRVVFTGDATVGDAFTGILHDPGVNQFIMPSGATTFSDLSADHLADVISMLSPTLIGQTPQWYMHRTVFNIMRKLKNDSNDYIYSSPSAAGDPGLIWGYPYTLVESLPGVGASAVSTPFIFFGNMDHYYIGDRKKMTVARSDHVGFAQDKVFLRVIQREGMGFAMPETGIAVTTAAA